MCLLYLCLTRLDAAVSLFPQLITLSSINRTKKMRKDSIVSLTIDYQQHVWAIDFNGLFLDFSALCPRRGTP